ncbi:MAG: PKD domain-containing protein [Thermoleophilia bacterium]|nr:PKD domain-containing protein [Thermoleophilia bacterium]
MPASRTLRRRSVALAALAGACAVPALASAAPLDAPALTPLPGFAQGTALGVNFAPAPGTFVSDHIGRVFEVRAVDQTGGPTVTAEVPAAQTGASLNLLNGHEYSVRVRAKATLVIDPPGPPPPIFIPQQGSWSAESVTRMDDTDPTGTVVVNGGALFTNTRQVTLALQANDPPSNGQPASGVGRVQLGEAGVIPCPNILLPGADTSGCPKPFAPSLPHTLKEGPDGPRTVSVRYRDQAVRTGTGLIVFLGPEGNASTIVNDQILLDTLAPTANVSQSATTVVQGTPVSVDAAPSVDGTNGPNDSGVDPASAQWAFGDGTTATGPTAAHTYAQPGTYSGSLTLKDRAGNQSTKQFSVTVTPPPAPQPPAGGSAGSGGQGLAPLAMGRINRVGNFRAGRSCAVSVTLNRRARVTADMRTARGRVVRRTAKTAGPGAVRLAMRCPAPGRYVITARSEGKLRTLAVRVRR